MTRKTLALAALLAGAVVCGARAGAVVCTPDPVPAATLLLPYFDLDTRDLARSKPKRATPVLAIVNAAPFAALARVTLWTDLSVPTLAFDLYLTGYDVEEVDLWKVFRGELPGDLAIPCNNGAQTTRQLLPEQVEALRLAHAGQPVPRTAASAPARTTATRCFAATSPSTTRSAARAGTRRSSRATRATSAPAASQRTTTC